MNYQRIPDEVIDAILKRHNIVDIVGRHVSLSKQGKGYKGLCPFHSEKTPSFQVSPDKQIFKCFGCGKGGNVIQFVMEVDSLTYPEAVRMLAEEIDIPISWQAAPAELSERQKERMRMIEAHELAAKWFHNVLMNTDAGAAAMRYLVERGFSPAVIQTFQLGYAPPMKDRLIQFLLKRGYDEDILVEGGLARATDSGLADLFRDRITFPIHDVQGRVIAFAGRVLGDGQPKFLNSPETLIFNKSRTLYNLHRAKADIRKSKRIVLFEGYADVIKAWEAGVHSGVATMGTSLAEPHIALLKRFAEEVVLCYDGDEAGQTAALKNVHLLERHRMQVKVSQLPPGQDPDDYITKHGAERFVREVIDPAIPALRFRLQRLRNKHALHLEDGKLAYIQSSLRIIAELDSPVEREHYLRDLASEFHYSLDTLKQECLAMRQELEKKQRKRDNNDISWNNVMNSGKSAERSPALLPAYQNAERHLLAIMMHDPAYTAYVEEQLGDAFIVETHAAIAAYIYAFYADHDEPDISKLIGMLDAQLGGIASAISLMYSEEAATPQVVDDYIKEIRKFPILKMIQQKKKELLEAERSGDVMKASQIGTEMITLEKKLKSVQ